MDDLDHEAIGVGEISYALDLAGHFKFISPEGERLSGYTREEALGMHVTEIVAPEFAELVRKQIARAVYQRVGTVYQIEIITKAGRRVTLETSMRVVTRDGLPIEIRGIALSPVGTMPKDPRRCVDAHIALGRMVRSR